MGVFVNLMADFNSRVIFKEQNSISKLIRILHIYGEIDWSLSMLICQVLWNFCIDSTNLHEAFGGTEIEELLRVLAEYLGKCITSNNYFVYNIKILFSDEEKLFGITESDENIDIFTTQEYIAWDEFANVATNLLEKIEGFLDNIEPLEITYSDDDDLCTAQNRENKTTRVVNW